mgnify:FL=1
MGRSFHSILLTILFTFSFVIAERPVINTKYSDEELLSLSKEQIIAQHRHLYDDYYEEGEDLPIDRLIEGDLYPILKRKKELEQTSQLTSQVFGSNGTIRPNDPEIISTDDHIPVMRNVNRSIDDTLQYYPSDGGWDSYFLGYQGIGDVFLMAYQMPADGTIKGVNVPIAHWGSGDQEVTISLHKLSYPIDADGAEYSTDYVNGEGWLGGYDMNSDGWMNIEGTNYSAGGTSAVCDDRSDTVIPSAQDPLGTEDANYGPFDVPSIGLIWPDGFTSKKLNPDENPAESDNWIFTTDYGMAPVLEAGDWVGVLVQLSGDGDDGDDDIVGFYYESAEGLVDTWPGLKFYGECGGTSAVSYTHLTLPTNREV